MRLLTAAITLVSLGLLAAPVAIGVWSTPDWRASGRFDGQAYLVSDADLVRQELDSSGAAAVLASIAGWRGGTMSEAEALTELEASGFDGQLATFEAAFGEFDLAGRWLGAAPGALGDLRTPFVAHLSDAGGRLALVRRVAAEHVYVADPLRGNALYPAASFLDVWTGQVFVFDTPLPEASP